MPSPFRLGVPNPYTLKHGMWNAPEYNPWINMIHRCHNPNHANYPQYGARGISVCQRWRDSVVAFREDMGPRTSMSHTLDRIDNAGNYEPGNCRWATRREQQMNRSCTVYLTLDGTTKALADWAVDLGLSRKLLHKRYQNGWPVERILTPSTRRSA